MHKHVVKAFGLRRLGPLWDTYHKILIAVIVWPVKVSRSNRSVERQRGGQPHDLFHQTVSIRVTGDVAQERWDA